MAVSRIGGTANQAGLTYPNGWVEEYSYDAEGNLLKTVDTAPFHNNKKSTKYQYTYDAEGNLITEYQRDSDGEAGLAANTTYTYDALNRLTGSKKTVDWTRKTYAKTYTYDSLGNLVRENGPDSWDQTTYQYNSLNQMVARKECGYVQSITRIHDYGYTYDGRGNLVKEEEICSPTTQGPKNITIATYTYDETNKMVSGTNKDGEASNYTFNGLGVRVGTEVIVKDNTHGYTDFHCQTPTVETGIDKPEVVLSDYVIDYTRLNIDQRVLVEQETDGYDFRYTYGLDLVNVKATGEGTNWWAQSVKKCVYSDYVHTDRLGSVVNLTDQYGRVPAQIDYDDWGKVTAYQSLNISGGYRTVLPEITYAGHQYDDVLGMYYAKARMYDAENRRFASVDPVKGRITDPMTMVQYLYVVDDPLRWVDPLGLNSIQPGSYIEGDLDNAPEIITDTGFPLDPDKQPGPLEYSIYWGAKAGAKLFQNSEPDAYKMLMHYLDGTGTPVEVDLNKAYLGDPGYKYVIDLEIQAMRKAVDYLYEENPQSHYAIISAAPVGVPNGQNNNWRRTIGAFYCYLYGEATIDEVHGNATMKVTVYMKDAYNFNPGESEIQMGIPDELLGSLAVVGLAKGFDVTGQFTTSTSWRIGNARWEKKLECDFEVTNRGEG